jgi:hypothetical protein
MASEKRNGLKGHSCWTPRWRIITSTVLSDIRSSRRAGDPYAHVVNGSRSGKSARTSLMMTDESTSLNAFRKSSLTSRKRDATDRTK